jgi:hypothetical protein
LPEIGIQEIYGGYGTGKSFLASDLACCVAAKIPWHGHEVVEDMSCTSLSKTTFW